MAPKELRQLELAPLVRTVQRGFLGAVPCGLRVIHGGACGPLDCLVRVHVELLGELRKGLVAPIRRRRHLRLELRPVIPSWPSRHPSHPALHHTGGTTNRSAEIHETDAPAIRKAQRPRNDSVGKVLGRDACALARTLMETLQLFELRCREGLCRETARIREGIGRGACGALRPCLRGRRRRGRSSARRRRGR